MKFIGLLIVYFFVQGCSIHYYDKETGVEHLWGFGHLQVKNIPDNNTKATATEIETIGLNIGLGTEKYSIGLGYDKETRVHILDPEKDIFINIEDSLFDAKTDYSIIIKKGEE